MKCAQLAAKPAQFLPVASASQRESPCRSWLQPRRKRKIVGALAPEVRRRVRHIGSVALLLATLFLAPQFARAQSVDQVAAQAKLGYVTDLAGVLSPSAKAQLTALCTEVQQKTQAQIAVVTIKSLGDQPIEDYSIDLATKLGVGPKSDRGILILFAVDDHKYRFEVGYGLEPILPDGKVGTFGREAVPYLRQADYDDAILLVTRLVANTIAADRGVTLATPSTVRAPRPAPNARVSPGVPLFFIIAVIFVIISAIRRAVSPAAASRYRRGGGSWWIGPMIGGMGGGFGGGGGGFGGGGGGGGFGGFGGGSFGGGGASGSW
ncbi:MAG: TPM domain-containing protein [Candidatus Acidiferrales bacterium]